jgi:hypothetical protein
MKKIFLWILPVLACAVLSAEALFLGQNEILNEGRWTLTKSTLSPALEGGADFLISRAFLAGYSLNLDQGHGYQEMRLHSPVDADRWEMDFVLEKGAYLDVLYAWQRGTDLGFRLSANPQFPPLVYTVLSDGRFSLSRSEPALAFPPGRHHLSARRISSGLQLEGDGGSSLLIPGKFEGVSLEVRGSRFHSAIAKVSVYRGNEVVVKENFHSFALWKRFFFPLLVFFVGLGFLFKNHPSFLPKAAVFLCLWLSFDFFYYSRCPILHQQDRLFAFPRTLAYVDAEKARRSVFDGLYALYGMKNRVFADRLRPEPYRPPVRTGSYCDGTTCFWAREERPFSIKEKNEIRLLFMGGSFFKGTGIGDIKNTVMFSVWHSFGANIPQGKKVTALNIATSGGRPGEQADLFFERFTAYRPDYIFFGGFPGRDHDVERTLRLWRYARENHIHMILVKAPTNPEYAVKDFSANRLSMLSKKFSFPTVVLSDLSLQPAFTQSGFIWWDEAHVTDYGGRALGEFAAGQIHNLLKKEAP